MTLLSSAFDQVKKNTGSFLNNLNEEFKAFQQLPQQVQATGQLLNQGLQDRAGQAGEAVSSIPYKLSNYQKNLRIKNATPYEQTPFMQKREDNYTRATPAGKKAMGNILGAEPQMVAGESAQLTPYRIDTTPALQTNPYLEGLKQQVLNNPAFRPAAKKYLSNIPVVFKDLSASANENGTTPTGQTDSNPEIQNPYIAITEEAKNYTPQDLQDSKHKDNYIKSVIEHELLHQTPNLVPTELFHPDNKKIIDHYTENRWGKEYMKRPGALIGEMFAEQDLPPAYYWHIFKSVNPRSTKQNFLTYLKSWFYNELNDPSQVLPENPSVQAQVQQGTIVPNSGGGPVQQ